jgi:hypothetical protein
LASIGSIGAVSGQPSGVIDAGLSGADPAERGRRSGIVPFLYHSFRAAVASTTDLRVGPGFWTP